MSLPNDPEHERANLTATPPPHLQGSSPRRTFGCAVAGCLVLVGLGLFVLIGAVNLLVWRGKTEKSISVERFGAPMEREAHQQLAIDLFGSPRCDVTDAERESIQSAIEDLMSFAGEGADLRLLVSVDGYLARAQLRRPAVPMSPQVLADLQRDIHTGAIRPAHYDHFEIVSMVEVAPDLYVVALNLWDEGHLPYEECRWLVRDPVHNEWLWCDWWTAFAGDAGSSDAATTEKYKHDSLMQAMAALWRFWGQIEENPEHLLTEDGRRYLANLSELKVPAELDGNFRLHLGWLWLRLNPAEAIRQFERVQQPALRLSRQLGEMEAHSAAGDHERAMKAAQRYLQDIPNSPRAHWHVAKGLASLGRLGESWASVDRVIPYFSSFDEVAWSLINCAPQVTADDWRQLLSRSTDPLSTIYKMAFLLTGESHEARLPGLMEWAQDESPTSGLAEWLEVRRRLFHRGGLSAESVCRQAIVHASEPRVRRWLEMELAEILCATGRTMDAYHAIQDKSWLMSWHSESWFPGEFSKSEAELIEQALRDGVDWPTRALDQVHLLMQRERFAEAQSSVDAALAAGQLAEGMQEALQALSIEIELELGNLSTAFARIVEEWQCLQIGEKLLQRHDYEGVQLLIAQTSGNIAPDLRYFFRAILDAHHGAYIQATSDIDRRLAAYFNHHLRNQPTDPEVLRLFFAWLVEEGDCQAFLEATDFKRVAANFIFEELARDHEVARRDALAASLDQWTQSQSDSHLLHLDWLARRGEWQELERQFNRASSQFWQDMNTSQSHLARCLWLQACLELKNWDAAHVQASWLSAEYGEWWQTLRVHAARDRRLSVMEELMTAQSDQNRKWDLYALHEVLWSDALQSFWQDEDFADARRALILPLPADFGQVTWTVVVPNCTVWDDPAIESWLLDRGAVANHTRHLRSAGLGDGVRIVRFVLNGKVGWLATYTPQPVSEWTLLSEAKQRELAQGLVWEVTLFDPSDSPETRALGWSLVQHLPVAAPIAYLNPQEGLACFFPEGGRSVPLTQSAFRQMARHQRIPLQSFPEDLTRYGFADFWTSRARRAELQQLLSAGAPPTDFEVQLQWSVGGVRETNWMPLTQFREEPWLGNFVVAPFESALDLPWVVPGAQFALSSYDMLDWRHKP